MRLIDANTLKFVHFDHENRTSIPRDGKQEPEDSVRATEYAILSHTWFADSTQEVTYHDFLDPAVRGTKPGFDKILQCCQLALSRGLKYVWVDTCCINKDSSAELQEAINSMYTWYQNSTVCYVFLTDRQNDGPMDECRWFTRGWTLQELLAPGTVEFYDLLNGSTRPVNLAGRQNTRADLARDISRITGIEGCYLTKDESTDQASVAKRMSWVSRRVTKFNEDMAYCMLGLFDVSLPLLYGEGWGAFRRLQEAIIGKSDDESIFAWQSLRSPRTSSEEPRGMIASFPSEFQDSGRIQQTDFHSTRPPYTVTNRGVSFHNPARSVPGLVTRWMRQSTFNGMWNSATRPFHLRLNCEDQDGCLIAIKLAPDAATETFYRTNSTSLERCAREGPLGRMAVMYGGYEQLYIKPPQRQTRTQQPALPGVSLNKLRGCLYHSLATVFSFDSFLLCLVIQSFSCFVLTADFLHEKLRLEPLSKLNVFLGWAYLTLGWKALGQNFYFWLGALAFGFTRARWPGMEIDIGREEMMGALLAPGMVGVTTWCYTGVRRWFLG